MRDVLRVLVGLALIAGALPAAAETRPACGVPRAQAPSETARRSGPPLRVTPAHTAARPLTVRYDHAPGRTVYHQAYLMEDTVHTLVQVTPREQRAALWVRATFPAGPTTDVDLYLYDAAGRMRAASDSANNDVEDAVYRPVFGGTSGGPGFENVDALRVRRCASLTVETTNSMTLTQPRTPVTLTFWLTPPPAR